jgi:hypothetical protein
MQSMNTPRFATRAPLRSAWKRRAKFSLILPNAFLTKETSLGDESHDHDGMESMLLDLVAFLHKGYHRRP